MGPLKLSMSFKVYKTVTQGVRHSRRKSRSRRIPQNPRTPVVSYLRKLGGRYKAQRPRPPVLSQRRSQGAAEIALTVAGVGTLMEGW